MSSAGLTSGKARYLIAALFATSAACLAWAFVLEYRESGEAEAARLRGLWEVTSVRNLTKGELQPPRREFHLFSDTHQMVILAGENRPKLPKSLSDMTPEEFQSQQPIGAGFYSYQLEGEKIVRTNIVALSAHYEGLSFIGEVEAAADTLVLRDRHSADGDLREWTMRRVD